MRILVLGGTAFLSAEIVHQALVAGHEVHALVRGSAGGGGGGREDARVQWHHADRDLGAAAYSSLRGSFDAVLDVTMQPHHAHDAVVALGDRAGHWTLVSTASVYADDASPFQDEDAPLVDPAPAREPMGGMENYGAAKVRCELEVLETAGEKAHISRSGLIVGPGDRSDRFGYWPWRFARGGEILLPRGEDSFVQYLDVRDYAAFLLKAATEGVVGTINASGASLSWQAEVARWVEESGGDADLRWVQDEWLLEHEVNPWAGPTSLPLWLPEGYAGFATRDTSKAVAAGLRIRPFEDTWGASLGWESELSQRQGPDRARRAGLTSVEEESLLREWDASGT